MSLDAAESGRSALASPSPAPSASVPVRDSITRLNENQELLRFVNSPEFSL